jgi:hypothetical protein
MITSSKSQKSNTSLQSSQATFSKERMDELRTILNPMDKKYNVRNFLLSNNIDPAYMNFYKFLKDKDFQLPLLGLIKLIETAGFDIQLCIKSKDTVIDDNIEWNKFLENVGNMVDEKIVTKPEKVKKKRESSNIITKSMSEDITGSEIEIKGLMEDMW